MVATPSRWKPFIGLGVALAAAAPATSAMAVGPQAALGWRIVYRHVTTNSFSSYRAVATSGLSHAWAVGGTGVAGYGSPIAAHWHHGRWSATAMPSRAVGSVVAVSADGPRDAWAVTVGNVLHWHTGRWTIVKSFSLQGGPPGFQSTGITALSPTDVWVFGGTGHWAGRGTWHFNGHTWTKVADAGHNIFEASALSPRSMWAIGGRNGDSILRYANGRWRLVTSPALAGLQFDGIFAGSATSVWVTASEADGSTGARLLHLNGTHWSAYHIPWQVQLRWLYSVTAGGGISPDGRGGFWIPTQSTSSPFWMLHFRAGKWSRVGLTSRVYRVAHIPGTTSLWGSGEILRKSSATGTIWAYGRLG
ncbi:MAG TPA: hypothetical protein VF940_02370 [Streptosporangiaceae bacterium]